MRAMTFRDGVLAVKEVQDPVARQGQVLVKTLACGICGSDLHALSHAHDMAEARRASGATNLLDPSADLIMGHEFCGEVLETCALSKDGVKVGDHVVSVPFVHGPEGTELIGFSTRFSGGFAERMLLPEENLLVVPNGLPPVEAALTEPLAVGAHAVALARQSGPVASLVVGCGPIGLAVIASLVRSGAGPIIASDFSPERRRLAERLGAHIVVDPANDSPHQKWSALNVPATLAELDRARFGKVDISQPVIYECVGTPGLIKKLIEEAPPLAHLVVVGASHAAESFVPMLALRKQMRISFSAAYSVEEFADTLRGLAEGELPAETFLTELIGLDQTPGAFEELSRPNDQVKVMVQPWRT